MLSTKIYKQKRSLVAFEGILVIIGLAFLYPFYIMLFVAVKSGREAIMSPASFPREWHFENFLIAGKKMKFFLTFFNSFTVTAVAVFGVVLLAGMASFIIVKSRSKFVRSLYLLFISGTIIPFFTSMVPLIRIMGDLNLLNSRLGLSLVYIGKALPFAIFLYAGFIRSLPNSIIESVQIDGANRWQTYWSIIFPMIKPITATVVIVDVLWFWNDFLLPLLTLGKRRLNTIPMVQNHFHNEFATQWELSFAVFVLAMIPVLLVFFALQKYVVSGMTSGALKG
ncbi:carbohydrate ABC transporter permease [Oceanispirochaeta crateris]|uniref:sn-glycerol-3-phosphate transport system permease protein UgpE n=1 Tax=Oceanispirochaeta crateris TaxID=2518645 RepID=A0A5C1QQ02_9SPIO|nr:carbohydrate ABC transporter permease [Oceanispirochaeta crateris]QEN09438.1 carbohydrate ABC transporter permease [Oceanispirochaeta crateris]